MIVALFILLAASFVISCGTTFAMRHIAPRIGFVDKPGHRKIHYVPKPLLGGVGTELLVTDRLAVQHRGGRRVDDRRRAPRRGGRARAAARPGTVVRKTVDWCP